MSEAYTGEIRILPYTFAPLDWAWCNGQEVSINQFQALSSIVGTIYGGDGRTTVGLPNLKGRMPLHPGRGPGLSQRQLGRGAGSDAVTLTVTEMPSHSHDVYVDWAAGQSRQPNGGFVAGDARNPLYKSDPEPATLVQMSPYALAAVGGGQPHVNIQPSLALNFCICLNGEYPMRP